MGGPGSVMWIDWGVEQVHFQRFQLNLRTLQVDCGKQGIQLFKERANENKFKMKTAHNITGITGTKFIALTKCNI